MTFKNNECMKQTIYRIIYALILFNFIAMQAQSTPTAEAQSELLNQIEISFAQGALNALNYEAMYDGFHSDFSILIPTATQDLLKLPRDQWIALVKAYKEDAEQVASGVRNLAYTIEILDMTDTLAVVKTEYFRETQLVITDYLSYIKFDTTWKAVSKISKDHIDNPLNLHL